MHWTLLVMLSLCAACLALNAAQWFMTGSVRVAGILICAAWTVQEAFWWRTGDDSLALFIACDTAIVAWFLYGRFVRRRVFDIGERLIAATIPITTAIVVGSHLVGYMTPSWWWINIAIVAGQMVLGLPWPSGQRSLGQFSHGALREAANERT